MPLTDYRRKRDFRKTPEPSGAVDASAADTRAADARRPRRGALRFVIQQHDATRMHWDFRLEMEGVLRSWAVPKGPSLNPAEKRLAVETEDHPIEYGTFEGVIPENEYGAGTVIVWDRGRWTPQGDPVEAYHAGRLKFTLSGKKLRGGWTLVRMRPREEDRGRNNWLLIKERDEEAREQGEIVEQRPESVKSGRPIAPSERRRRRAALPARRSGGSAATAKPRPKAGGSGKSAVGKRRAKDGAAKSRGRRTRPNP